MVKFQRAQRGVKHGSRPIWQTSHILLFPPQAKLWADPLQVFNDFLKRGITRIASVIRAELRHQVLCLLLPVPVDCASEAGRARESEITDLLCDSR